MTDPEIEAHGGWPGVLGVVCAGEDLSSDAAAAAMAEILAGRASAAQIAGLITALRLKGESVPEMTGLADAMLTAAEPLAVPAGAIDIVGTGGSPHRRKHALNVSTMASLVAVGAGAVVCKHGNFRASSTSGSFDFLEELGVNTGLDGPALERCVSELGVGFALARTFHPAMRHAGPVRAELGIPTVFNLLGPVAHPGRIKRQLIGTADEATAELLAAVVQAMGAQRAWVVTGAGGIDELSTTGPSVVFDVRPSGIKRVEIDPALVGIDSPASMDALAGGTAAENVAIFHAILDGSESGPRHDIVALNAGAGLVVAGIAPDVVVGTQMAAEAIGDGRVRGLVEDLVGLSNELASG